MRSLMAMAVLAAEGLALTAPALADFYIIRQGPAGHCAVVGERPADGHLIVGGDRNYATRAAAEKQLPLLCRSE